jgi:type VI secretion system secreted protein Hcp
MPVPAALFYSNGITGDNPIRGREDSSEVIEFEHNLRIPLDVHMGTVSGKRVHAPVEITKAIDAATPMLYQACAEGKTLDELTIEWYRINDQGVEELYFTHTLHRVKIAEVRALLPNTKDPSKERLTHLEQVKLMYEEIEWNNVQAKKQYADSWMENA